MGAAAAEDPQRAGIYARKKRKKREMGKIKKRLNANEAGKNRGKKESDRNNLQKRLQTDIKEKK